jgi:aryl-alcohol dehydrogenase-like predicted oxidoreductase
LEEAWKKRAVERNWRTLDVIGEIAGETGKSYAQISLNWLLHQPGLVAPILGARRLDQIEDNIGAVGWELSEEQVARLSGVSAPLDLYPYNIIRGAQRI